MRHPMTAHDNTQQEQHVFAVTDAAQHVTITLRTSDGHAIATATHPLQHAFEWGAERCRLPLLHPDTNAPAGSLHIGFEYSQVCSCCALRPPPPCTQCCCLTYVFDTYMSIGSRIIRRVWRLQTVQPLHPSRSWSRRSTFEPTWTHTSPPRSRRRWWTWCRKSRSIRCSLWGSAC